MKCFRSKIPSVAAVRADHEIVMAQASRVVTVRCETAGPMYLSAIDVSGRAL